MGRSLGGGIFGTMLSVLERGRNCHLWGTKGEWFLPYIGRFWILAASRMSLVISARFRTGLVPWILRAPRKMREIRGSLNTSIEMPFPIWTLRRAAVYCLTVSGLLNSTCSAIQLARTGNVTGIA